MEEEALEEPREQSGQCTDALYSTVLYSSDFAARRARLANGRHRLRNGVQATIGRSGSKDLQVFAYGPQYTLQDFASGLQYPIFSPRTTPFAFRLNTVLGPLGSPMEKL